MRLAATAAVGQKPTFPISIVAYNVLNIFSTRISMYIEGYVVFEHPSGSESVEIDTAAYIFNDRPAEYSGHTFVVEGVKTEKGSDGDSFECTPILQFDYFSIEEGKEFSLDAGIVLKIPTSFDEGTGDHVTNIYRTSHEEIDNVEIQVAEVSAEYIEARIFGQAQDGTWPDEKTTQEEARIFSDIYIHAKFSLDKSNKARW